jgi:tetratricopeptide (TPR) repeat protein
MKFAIGVVITGALMAAQSESPVEIANRGASLYVSGNYHEAETCYRRALESWPQNGQGLAGRAILLNNLGELLRITGRYREAELTVNQALETAERIGPAGRGYESIALDNLAVISRARGDLDKAEEYALRADPLVDESQKRAHRLVLASIYAEKQSLDRAKPLLLEAAASSDGRTSLTADIILSTAALGQKEYSEAERYARLALELAARALPGTHPAIAMALNDLAAACQFQGQFQEAEKRYREAIAMWEASVGPNHPDLARGIMGLASLYHERQREAGAETLYRRAVTILEKALGSEAPLTQSARLQLASVLRREGRVTEAAKLDGTK